MLRKILIFCLSVILFISVLNTGCSSNTGNENSAWRLVEVRMWNNYQAVTAPYNITWIGTEGDVTSIVTVDSPYSAVSSMNAKWMRPPEILEPDTEYRIECSVTVITQDLGPLLEEGADLTGVDVFNTLYVLRGGIAAGFDMYSALPDDPTGYRIAVIPDDDFVITWAGISGEVKSGTYGFKAPEYGFAKSRDTNRMTLTVQYNNAATIAWMYIYEWMDKSIIPTVTETTMTQ